MEKLVREELERWDSEASMTRPDSRGPSPSASRVNTAKSGRSTTRGSSQSSAGSVRVPVNVSIGLPVSRHRKPPIYSQAFCCNTE